MENGIIASVYNDIGQLVTRKHFDSFWDIRPIAEAAFSLGCQVVLEQDGPEEEPEEENKE